MKNVVLNTLQAVGLTSILRMKKANRLTVLSLHRISDERNFFWDPISPKSFDQLLGYVKRHYQVVTFSDLLNGTDLNCSKPLLILSFDDGYYDFYENALPILTKHGLPANHNVVNACCEKGHVIWTERLNGVFQFAMQNETYLEFELPSHKVALSQFGEDWMQFYLATFKALLQVRSEARIRVIAAMEEFIGYRHQVKMMNWEEVKDCSRNGIEIGSHTMNHDVISTLDDKATLTHELVDSKHDLEEKLGVPIQVLALPNGQVGKSAYEVLRESDYKFVLHVDDRSMPISEINTESGYSDISRINLVNEPFPQMCLRAEQFHSIIRGNAR